MMDETATSSGAPADDPVINVIEPDPSPMADSAGGAAGADRFDHVAGDAVAARRRREFDAARARLRDQAIRADNEWSQAGGQRPFTADASGRGGGDEPATRWVPLANPPEKVRKRYLREGNQYFLKDAPHQLAFEDIGPCLVTGHNRPDVVESMVDMVCAKAWGRIRVSGHELFRREVWAQATLLGIEVSGYEPKAVDLARVAEGRRERMTNRIDVSETTAAAPASAGQQNPPNVAVTASGSRAAQPVNADPPRQSVAGGSAPSAPKDVAPDSASPDTGPGGTDAPGQERQRYVGELVEHGGAPFQHNPARSDSYYVVYRGAAGADHVVWGVDLERAVAESGARPGQPVSLENLGRRWVNVKVPVLDEAGKVIGEEEKEVYRNTWQVDVMGREHAESRPGTPAQQGETVRAAPARQQEPVAGQRDRPLAAPQDRAVQLAVLVAAMREHGFGERSIARVQQRAERMLDAFQAEGVPVPRPRVFDPEAPSTRGRRARATTGLAQTREVERAPSEPPAPAL